MSDLPDQEKSVLLAKAMGWTTRPCDVDDPNLYMEWALYDSNGGRLEVAEFWEDANEKEVWDYFDLYDPANMSLAWRVLNWAWGKHDRMVLVVNEEDEVVVEPLKYWTWRLMNVLWEAGAMEPERAVRHILDSILNLAVGAGIIEANNE